MKKIVSNTILTALAATNLTTIAAQSVSATTKADDSINANINEEFNNSIDVTVEDTESIESSNTENSSNNDETGEGSIDSEINDEDNCYYDEKTDCCNDSCMMEKLKNLDCKVIVGAGIGALIGCIGLCLLLKKK